MPITYIGLRDGLQRARLGAAQTSGVYIKALTAANAVLGQSALADWGGVSDKSDGSAFKARERLDLDTVINIDTTGVVAKLQFVFIGSMPPIVVSATDGGIRFDITLDNTLSVVKNGYLTVKGASDANTYLEIQSSKSS